MSDVYRYQIRHCAASGVEEDILKDKVNLYGAKTLPLGDKSSLRFGINYLLFLWFFDDLFDDGVLTQDAGGTAEITTISFLP